ncbi:3-oxoadipate enol-lactonase [Pokkaliibacter sp. MBI-7]|uniref:3-oxoadipate enol-lactonase n=1 Tax=Pokkaliibacter sp. MBI-7 TaxID=3040600 RepID=UPI00244D24C4|nr:3-oxoadipate enol-lactonase [Pokkaliibacter sp. MBI-7]MDH2433575.1 3-oxoadipate enol-lactonase [Pokkaliibacter sp. MBI-7]
MNVLNIDGCRIHYSLESTSQDASGPIMVFANSLGTDFRVWNPLLPYLSAAIPGIRFLRYDKRGHGLSTSTPAPYSMQRHIDDLVMLLDSLQLKQVLLCGLSVGGVIAQGVAAQRSDLVKALVLCDTAHKIGTEDGWNTRISLVREQGLASIADNIMKVWFARDYHANHQDELQLWKNMLINSPVEGYVGTCAALRDNDLTASTSQLTLPTLCVVGEEDGSTPPALVESMAQLIKGSRFVTLPDAAHIPCAEQPEALAGHIATFFKENGLV